MLAVAGHAERWREISLDINLPWLSCYPSVEKIFTATAIDTIWLHEMVEGSKKIEMMNKKRGG